MRRIVLVICAAIGLAATAGFAERERREAGKAPEATTVRCVVRVDLALIISRAAADYLATGIEVAEAQRCAVLAVLDTPGGELEATRRMVQAILASRVPVIVYVAPMGARAGSAGMFVTLAAHVAAMAPGTSIGASHPVIGTGQDPEQVGGEHLGRKVENDAAALARAIAQRRDRNVEWAEAAVRQSVSSTASEALEDGVIDRIATGEAELLAAIDGTTVATTAGPTTLATRGAVIRDHDMTLSQRVLSVIGNPATVYLLFMLGVLGLVLELSNPGMIIPGALGGLALVLAALGMNLLPVQLGAILLLVAGAGALVAEIFVASYGLLALGGIIMLALGASLLVDHDTADYFADATLGVSWELIAPFVVLVAAIALLLAWRARRVRRRAAVTGLDAMIGHIGRVEIEITDEPGQVLVDGEHWRAIADAAIPAGRRVRVDDIHGLTVHVTPLDASAASGGLP
jgi:membrane-bound serine protease (ClpP class)